MISIFIKWLCKVTRTWKQCHKHYCYKDERWEPEHQNCRCFVNEYKAITDDRIKIAKEKRP